MVNTRNQAKRKNDDDYEKAVNNSLLDELDEDFEEFESPNKYLKEADDDDLMKALAESLAIPNVESAPTTDKPVQDSPSFTTLISYLKVQGFSLPRFYKDLNKVLELVESDEVAGTRMVMVYFYHNNTDSQKFVENVFIDKSFVEIVNRNFIVWAADMSKEEDKLMVENQLEWELSREVVDMMKQYEVEQFPLIMIVMLLEGSHQVMKVFSGVGNVDILCQGLSESVQTYKNIVQETYDAQEVTEELKVDKVEQVKTKSIQDNLPVPVHVELQVGPCLHPVQLSPDQQLVDLLQYVSRQTGLEVGKFSLWSYPGTDLTSAMDTLTLHQLGLKGGARVRLRIAKK